MHLWLEVVRVNIEKIFLVTKEEASEKFGDMEDFRTELGTAIGHLQSFYPEAKVPKIQGVPGRYNWIKVMPANTSARICAKVPAIVTGDIAPDKMNGVTTHA